MVDENKYAGFGIRFVALLIDAVVLGVAAGVLRGALPFMKNSAFSTVTGALYAILLWVNWNGQTLGKKAMKIKVVKENGSPLSYQDAIIRYVGYFISSLVLGLGFFWVIWDSKKQGWHDKIAKTLVVKE